MSDETFIPTDVRAMAVLREAEKPLTTDEILERLPTDVGAADRSPREWLRSCVLQRPEVGRVGRGLYVYLPTRISGSTLRVPLTGHEVQDSTLRLGPDLAYALWFPAVGYYSIRTGATATCELPNGQQAALTPGEYLRRTGQANANEFGNWLRQERFVAGDSLLFHLQDTDTNVCRVSLERLVNRDATRITERNRQLADMAEQLLREARQPLRPLTLASHLMARDIYRNECPPDPFYVVLYRFDNRFVPDGIAGVALATTRDRRRSGTRAVDDTTYELEYWLKAVGYGREQRDKLG
jgi:hypothetical protein